MNTETTLQVGMAKKWQWLIIAACALAFLVLSSHWWLLYGGPVRGSVLDASNSQPLPNTMVVVKWIGSMSGMHGASYPCYHVVLTKTGDDGRFYVPFWWKQTYTGANSWLQGIWTTTMERPVEVTAFKPGYVVKHPQYPIESSETEIIFMEPFGGTTQKRLGDLVSMFDREVMCEADAKTLIPVRLAAYEEGKAIARSREELRTADILLTGLEAAQLGSRAALQRAGVREVERSQQPAK